jgi:hypothetical protein
MEGFAYQYIAATQFMSPRLSVLNLFHSVHSLQTVQSITFSHYYAKVIKIESVSRYRPPNWHPDDG